MKLSDFKFKFQYRNEVTEIISDLVGEGATFQEIADDLNEREFDTFSGAGKWHPQTVHRIFKRYSE